MSELPKQDKVQLGCGTLVIIAIIVMIFSGNKGSKRMQTRVDELNAKIDRLERKIDDLSKKLDSPRSVSPTPSSAN